jgi:hypothetical protein
MTILLYCALALLLGYAAGFFHCWRIARAGMQEIAEYMEPHGRKLVHDERAKLGAAVTEAYKPATERLGPPQSGLISPSC